MDGGAAAAGGRGQPRVLNRGSRASAQPLWDNSGPGPAPAPRIPGVAAPVTPPLAPAGGEALVLASSSPTRRRLLEAAGVPFEADPPRVDEGEVKRSMRAEGGTAEAVAGALAGMKASGVSNRRPGRMVLGADQVLECGGVQHDKPGTRAAAAEQLRALRGRRHRLVTAAVVVRDGVRLWQALEAPTLEMRAFSDGFVESYLDAAGDDALGGPGAYRVEGLGAQLFRGVGGDLFTVLGLPLLPLLGFLRANGALAE